METYSCKCCLYNTNNITHFKRHNKTKKHLKQMDLANGCCKLEDEEKEPLIKSDITDTDAHDTEDGDENHNFFVYLLIASDNSTYVGATVNLDRRLRQHNKEIKGGAIATSIKVNKGYSWTRVCFVKNFPSWQSALQFEWKWKHESRKLFKLHKLPLKRRIHALKNIMMSDRSTSKAIPFSEWIIPPDIIFENNTAETLFNSDSL